MIVVILFTLLAFCLLVILALCRSAQIGDEALNNLHPQQPFPNTEPLRSGASPAEASARSLRCGVSEAAPEGPGTDGHKPLMRNREGHDQSPSATGHTAGENFSGTPEQSGVCAAPVKLTGTQNANDLAPNSRRSLRGQINAGSRVASGSATKLAAMGGSPSSAVQTVPVALNPAMPCATKPENLSRQPPNPMPAYPQGRWTTTKKNEVRFEVGLPKIKPI